MAAESLGRLYASARLHGNLFQPSFKLREKRREGARVLHPDRFTADHLRTVQRFMKVRRLTMTRKVLLGPVPKSASTVIGVMGGGDAMWAGGDTKSLSNISS